MTAPIAPATAGTSTRPYLIRALHDWCTDNGFTPYIAVYVDDHVQVPKEYVKNHEIVLNVGFEATSALKLGNELIEFKARFGGTSREIAVPIDHVIAIYAARTGRAWPSDARRLDAIDLPTPSRPPPRPRRQRRRGLGLARSEGGCPPRYPLSLTRERRRRAGAGEDGQAGRRAPTPPESPKPSGLAEAHQVAPRAPAAPRLAGYPHLYCPPRPTRALEKRLSSVGRAPAL